MSVTAPACWDFPAGKEREKVRGLVPPGWAFVIPDAHRPWSSPTATSSVGVRFLIRAGGFCQTSSEMFPALSFVSTVTHPTLQNKLTEPRVYTFPLPPFPFPCIFENFSSE
jgi:hypothetical protein